LLISLRNVAQRNEQLAQISHKFLFILRSLHIPN